MRRSPLLAVLLILGCDHPRRSSGDGVASAQTQSARSMVDETTVRACTLSYGCGLSHPGLGTSMRRTSIDFATCTKTVSSESGPFERSPGPLGRSDASTHTSSSAPVSPTECVRLQKLTAAITGEDAKRESESAQVDTEACDLTLACPPDSQPKFSVQRQSLTGAGAVVTLIDALQRAR